MSELPDCYCDDFKGCDWKIRLNIEVIKGDDTEKKFGLNWERCDISAYVAQAIFQSSIAAINQAGWGLYNEVFLACMKQEDDEKMADRVKAYFENI